MKGGTPKIDSNSALRFPFLGDQDCLHFEIVSLARKPDKTKCEKFLSGYAQREHCAVLRGVSGPDHPETGGYVSWQLL
jgi:hypothetical protein